jgi:hypothetical protein
MNSNRIRILFVSLMAVFAVSAVASATASAAPTCYRVAVAGSGAWEKNNCTTLGGTKEYVMIEKLENLFKSGGPGEPDEWCAKVKAGEPSRFSNNTCTTAHVGTGEFLKVLRFKRVWEVCVEKAGAGTEPPIKYDNEKCNSKTKLLAERKWEWVSVTSKKKVTSKGGEFKLVNTTAGKEVVCTGVTNTGEVGPGGESENVVLNYTGCTNGPKTCEAFAPTSNDGKGEIEVTNVDDQLVERATSGGVVVLADEFFSDGTEFVTIEFEAAGTESCTGFTPTKVKGQVAGECNNLASAGEVELNFPNPELTGNSLEAFGSAAKLFGSATVKLEGSSAAVRCV